jgi:hypothetical protein
LIAVDHNAGVIHKNIQAVKLSLDVFNCRLEPVLIGDIQQFKVYIQALALQARTGSRTFVWIPDPQNYRNAPLREAPANSISDASITSGYQCDAFVMIGHANFLRLSAILYKNRRLRSQMSLQIFILNIEYPTRNFEL